MALTLATKQRALAGVLKQCTRSYAGYWNHEWRPGPYPKTEEERRAAAKKYGMIPADYQPYPDDGTGYGDYPMLEPISAESRDQTERYDNPEYKRNYGEPLHVDADLYGEDRWDVNKKFPFSHTWILGTFFSVLIAAAILHEAGQHVYFHWNRAMTPQQPYSGKKNYTFETVPLD